MTKAAAPLCAQCRKRPIDADYRPFCSKRCADIDLQGWFTGRYATPAASQEIEGEDEV